MGIPSKEDRVVARSVEKNVRTIIVVATFIRGRYECLRRSKNAETIAASFLILSSIPELTDLS